MSVSVHDCWSCAKHQMKAACFVGNSMKSKFLVLFPLFWSSSQPCLKSSKLLSTLYIGMSNESFQTATKAFFHKFSECLHLLLLLTTAAPLHSLLLQKLLQNLCLWLYCLLHSELGLSLSTNNNFLLHHCLNIHISLSHWTEFSVFYIFTTKISDKFYLVTLVLLLQQQQQKPTHEIYIHINKKKCCLLFNSQQNAWI